MTIIPGIVLIGIKIRFTHPKDLVFRKSKVLKFLERNLKFLFLKIFSHANFIGYLHDGEFKHVYVRNLDFFLLVIS